MCEPKRAAVPGVAVVAVVMVAAVGGTVWWLLVKTPFPECALGVLSALSVAGVAVFTRNVVRDHGTLWKPAKPVQQVGSIPQPELTPVVVPVAIAARKVIPGVVEPVEVPVWTAR